MLSVFLLLAVTALYAGYNLLIKVSGSYVPGDATSTILATISLQLAALATSGVFAAVLLLRGGHNLQLGSETYLWALTAGLCIGGAEIAYFYLFGGLGGGKAMPANIAIPVIVSGTIVITMIVAYFLLKEPMTWRQVVGCFVIIAGIGILFTK
jgi:drug/metabolite transporter (DMT)-like permease